MDQSYGINANERRSIERLSMNAPAKLGAAVSDDTSTRLTHRVVCQDISSKGGFFVTDEEFDIGAKIEAQMSYYMKNRSKHSKSASKSRRVNMTLMGTVIRVEASGIAVRFDKNYSIRLDKENSGEV